MEPETDELVDAESARIRFSRQRDHRLIVQAAEIANGRSLDDLESTGLSLRADVSALLLHDPRDRQVPISESAIVAAAWPNARLHQIAGVGHNGILAADSVHRLLLDFIAPPVRAQAELALAS